MAFLGQDITQNQTTIPLIFGPVVYASDNTTGVANQAANLSVTLSKNGAAFAAPAGAISEVGGAGNGQGYYQIAANATDSNTLGLLIVSWAAGNSGGVAWSAGKTHVAVKAVNPYSNTTFVASVPAVTGNVGGNVNGSIGSLPAGAIDLPQLTPALKEILLRGYLTITGGTTNPATTDNYFTAGLYNNGTSTIAYYESAVLGTAIYAWTDGTYWYLTTTNPGNLPANGTSYFKTASGATIAGPFALVANGGTGSGTPTVAVHGNSILSGFQPEALNFTVRTTYPLVKGQALPGFEFVMLDSTTHLPKVGLGAGISGTVSHDRGAFGPLTNGITEIANGVYGVDLTAADLNGTNVTLRFSATNADDTILTLIMPS